MVPGASDLQGHASNSNKSWIRILILGDWKLKISSTLNEDDNVLAICD